MGTRGHGTNIPDKNSSRIKISFISKTFLDK